MSPQPFARVAKGGTRRVSPSSVAATTTQVTGGGAASSACRGDVASPLHDDPPSASSQQKSCVGPPIPNYSEGPSDLKIYPCFSGGALVHRAPGEGATRRSHPAAAAPAATSMSADRDAFRSQWGIWRPSTRLPRKEIQSLQPPFFPIECRCCLRLRQTTADFASRPVYWAARVPHDQRAHACALMGLMRLAIGQVAAVVARRERARAA